jgi:hypothetical protein
MWQPSSNGRSGAAPSGGRGGRENVSRRPRRPAEVRHALHARRRRHTPVPARRGGSDDRGRASRDDRQRVVGCGIARGIGRGCRRGGLGRRGGRGGRRSGRSRMGIGGHRGGRGRHGLGLRGGSGRGRSRSDRRRGRRHDRGRQEPQWVEVALGLGRDTDPKMDVRLRHLGVSRGPCRGHGLTFADRRSFRDGERAEMRERDGVAVGRRDREALARDRDGSGERHRPGRGRDDAGAGLGAEIDAAVLAGCIGMRRVVGERLQHRPVDGPRPGSSRCCVQQCGDYRREQDSAHRPPPFSTRPRVRDSRRIGSERVFSNTVGAGPPVVKRGY